MRVQPLAAGLLACAALSLGGIAQAGDTIRLDLSSREVGAPTLDLKARPADLEMETATARWGWGWRGGWGRGLYWGGGVRFYGGYYGGFGAWYPRYPVAWWGPRFYGGWGPRFYGGGFYSGYYAPSYVYYGSYWAPCSIGPSVTVTQPVIPSMPRILEENGNGNGSAAPNNSAPVRPVPMPPASNGTFDYDGGPMNPVPMPKAPEPAQNGGHPSRPMLLNEILVSHVPASSGKWVYPAYGESPTRRR